MQGFSKKEIAEQKNMIYVKFQKNFKENKTVFDKYGHYKGIQIMKIMEAWISEKLW